MEQGGWYNGNGSGKTLEKCKFTFSLDRVLDFPTFGTGIFRNEVNVMENNAFNRNANDGIANSDDERKASKNTMAKDYAKALKAFRKQLTKVGVKTNHISVSEDSKEIKIRTRDRGLILPILPKNMKEVRAQYQCNDVHLYINKVDGSTFTEEELNVLRVQFEH